MIRGMMRAAVGVATGPLFNDKFSGAAATYDSTRSPDVGSYSSGADYDLDGSGSNLPNAGNRVNVLPITQQRDTSKPITVTVAGKTTALSGSTIRFQVNLAKSSAVTSSITPAGCYFELSNGTTPRMVLNGAGVWVGTALSLDTAFTVVATYAPNGDWSVDVNSGAQTSSGNSTDDLSKVYIGVLNIAGTTTTRRVSVDEITYQVG